MVESLSSVLLPRRLNMSRQSLEGRDKQNIKTKVQPLKIRPLLQEGFQRPGNTATLFRADRLHRIDESFPGLDLYGDKYPPPASNNIHFPDRLPVSPRKDTIPLCPEEGRRHEFRPPAPKIGAAAFA